MIQNVVALMLGLSFLYSCSYASEKKAAHYTKGTTKIIEQFFVNDKGIQKKIINSNIITSNNDILQDIIVKVPSGAFDRETQVSIGLNDGTLKLMEGQASGVVVDLQYKQPYRGIKYPIEFTFTLLGGDLSNIMIPPFLIMEDGSLVLCPFYAISNKPNTYTLRLYDPLMFTWIYFEY